MSFIWNHVETNRPQSDLTVVTAHNCTFESESSTSLLPSTFDAVNFQESNFTYYLFGFLNLGSGSAVWAANDYNYGISGTLRAGIGFFYFYEAYPPFTSDFSIVGEEKCFESDFEKINFWDYISTFWNFLDDSSRDMVENLWFGMVIAGGSLTKKGLRFLTAMNPQAPNICVFEDYFDLQVSPMLSRPVYLDPSEESPKTIINPIGTVLIEPEYDGFTPIYHDLIEITGNDYQKIRHLGKRLSPSSRIIGECYVVIQPKDASIEKKYFLVTNFLSSEEAYDRPASAIIKQEGKGSLKLIGVDTTDISQYRVTIQDTGLTSITWTSNALYITVNGSSPNQIQDIINALPGTGIPWAHIIDISAPNLKDAPLINNVDFEDLYNYVNAQTGVGRYYPDSGKVWKWYDGWNDSNGTIGNPSQGEYTESKSKFKYMIEVSGGLAYLKSGAFSIYLTTGKSYDIGKEIIDIPYLTAGIENEEIYFKKDIDYIFNKQVLEFFVDIFAEKGVKDNTILYCKKTPIIEQYLFEQHGGLVNINDWTQYNYKNISGKAAINTLLSAMMNISSLKEYEKALNIYYGLPVSPAKCRVVGLFESYGYKIIEISSHTITVEIKPREELHPFIQNNCVMINDDGKSYIVSGVFSNRSLGKFNVVDPDGLKIGDRLYVKLNNKFKLENVVHTGPYIDVWIREGYKPIKHVIDTVHNMYGTWPELLIHGTDKCGTNFDGLYHAVDAYHPEGMAGGIVRIKIYKPSDGEEPMYNDYIESTIEGINAGFAHICWPTHKFLYLYIIEEKRLYRAYMDAPIDTIYDSGDALEQYQIICRNVSIMNNNLFKNWWQYRNFRKSPGINSLSNIIEMVFADPSGEFGQYFPSGLYRD